MTRPVFGVDRDPGIFESTMARNKSGTLKENPLRALYGPSPDDKKCRNCVHLERWEMGHTWFKCDLRRNTSSTFTDHRATWPTCARFEEETDGSVQVS